MRTSHSLKTNLPVYELPMLFVTLVSCAPVTTVCKDDEVLTFSILPVRSTSGTAGPLAAVWQLG